MKWQWLVAGLLLIGLVACSSGTATVNDVVTDVIESDSADGRESLLEIVEMTAAEVDTKVPDEVAPECLTNEDCLNSVGSLSPCQAAICNTQDGTCMAGNLKNGTPCDDENPCTVESFCSEGDCMGSGETACDDQDPCTLDSCDFDAGCVHLSLDEGACDDGNPCTGEDACTNGKCQGVAIDCDCEVDADCMAFDDDNLCNGFLRCQNGDCLPDDETVVVCPAPMEACFLNMCNPETGACEETPVVDGGACSDGDSCTTGDSCADGKCVAGPNYVCDICTTDDDCSFLDEGNKCFGTHVCDEGSCSIDPATVPIAPEVTCYDATCDPATGQFVIGKQPDGTWCNDENACTTLDNCVNGTCKGVATSCDDGNVCTQDTCEPDSGCQALPLSDIPCDDNDACTDGDSCLDGECEGAENVVCDDSNPCTEDSCEPESGCLFASEPLEGEGCDDGDTCTEGDSCQEGLCVPGLNACECEVDDDCQAYEDLDLCNGTLHCVESKCVVDAETIVVCDPVNDTDCEYSVCNPVAGQCSMVTAPYGSPCDDGNECTLGETCFFGSCLGGILVTCDDGNSCTTDSCDPLFGCVSAPLDDVVCDDGDSCTSDDTCQDGECIGGASICGCQDDEDCTQFDDADLCNGSLQCSDSECVLDLDSVVVCPESEELCQVTSCKPSTGECITADVKDGAPCDDQDACTKGDTCSNGECVFAPVDCDDDNPCTVETCSTEDGCQYEALSDQACEDGNPCTENDMCEAGQCIPGANSCDCQTTEDCAESDDGNLCNGVMVCLDNTCVLDEESVVVCDTSADTECQKNLCDPQTGDCDLVVLPDGTVCDDGLTCTDGDVCGDGECGGDIYDCDDDNPCTDDICVEEEDGCVNVPNTAACSDDNACTDNDLCKAGKCSGESISCENDNPCTSDACDTEQGCTYAPVTNACDDGNACTDDDVCADGICAGASITCDDNQMCTDDSCDPDTGCQFYDNELACEDGDVCTINDVCSGGLCKSGAVSSCDDGQTCTTDSCDPVDGCLHVPLDGSSCDDGNPCTTGDVCNQGICNGEGSLDCDDDNSCSNDSCQPDVGCVNSPVTGNLCEDGSLCTENDSCDAGVCVGEPVVCNDGNVCTKDLCNPDTGCVFPAEGGAIDCQDGDPCTEGDFCQSGLCKPGSPKLCDDLNECTDDFCNPNSGACETSPNSDTCDDGNPCTTADACANESCVGGPAPDCNDGNPCTDDSCQPFVGCINADNGECQCQESEECQDDGNLCNGIPICQNNVCVTNPASIILCSDTEDTFCSKNICQPGSGDCVMTDQPAGVFCTDDDACTQGDECDGNGSCLGSQVTCDDDNVCTTDSCDVNSGCQYDANSESCSDGDPCTVDDICQLGDCLGTLFDCNDENICTLDQCIPNGGLPDCTYTPQVNTLCDDDDACTQDDECVAGSCTGEVVFCSDDNPCTLDECLQESGCYYPEAPEGTPCDDGVFCTENDLCDKGECESGSWLFNCCEQTSDCDDSYSCSTETCINNQCVYEALDCLDGNDCTADVCADGNCSHDSQRDEIILYSEDFDGNSSPGWQFTENVNGDNIFWSVDNERSVSGDYSLYAGHPKLQSYDLGVADAIAISPPVYLPADSLVDLDFHVFVDVEEDGCTHDYLKVSVITAGGDVKDLSPRICNSTNGFVGKTYFLDQYVGTDVRIRLQFKTVDAELNDGEGIYVDDMVMVTLPKDDCCVFDGDCTDFDPCTQDRCEQFSCDWDDVGGTYFAEDFESGSIELGNTYSVDKWYLTSSNAAKWQVDDERAFSTPYSLYAGEIVSHTYDVGAPVNANARSPRVILPAKSEAMLKFRLFADLHQPDCATDYFRVGISKGITGPTQYVYTQCDSTGGFIPVNVSLDEWSSSTIHIHFEFISDTFKNDGEGIYVDNIRVEKLEDPPSCCEHDNDCLDEDECTVEWCTGTEDGGVCMQRDLTDFSEKFDDGLAQGWTYSSSDDDIQVSWQVDGYRSKSAPNSLYCGSMPKHTYMGWNGGTVTAATPYITLDSSKNLTPKLYYSRLLDLYNSNNHCFTVKIQQKYVGIPHTVETSCGNAEGNNTLKFDATSYDLSAYMEKEIRVLFELQFPSFPYCPGVGDFEGVYLDDVRIAFEECIKKPK